MDLSILATENRRPGHGPVYAQVHSLGGRLRLHGRLLSADTPKKFQMKGDVYREEVNKSDVVNQGVMTTYCGARAARTGLTSHSRGERRNRRVCFPTSADCH